MGYVCEEVERICREWNPQLRLSVLLHRPSAISPRRGEYRWGTMCALHVLKCSEIPQVGQSVARRCHHQRVMNGR